MVGCFAQSIVAVTVSSPSLMPFSFTSAQSSTVFVLAIALVKVNADVPAAFVVPDPVEGDGVPPPVTVKATGMNCSFSPFTPVTWAVKVADWPQNCDVGPLIVKLAGGEKSTLAVKASVVPPAVARPSPHAG